MIHGKTCPKREHRGGELHDADDNSPYPVDGLVYCGRCHEFLGTMGYSAEHQCPDAVEALRLAREILAKYVAATERDNDFDVTPYFYNELLPLARAYLRVAT